MDNPATVLITGAAKRIGRTLALDLASDGWNVGVHYFNSGDEAAQLVTEISNKGGRAAALKADLGSSAQTTKLIADCTDTLGAPTCLINNSAIFLNDDIETLTPDSWDTHINVNLKAPVLLAQAFAATLPGNTDGNIINIIDQRVWKLTPLFFSYTVSKAGLWTVTQTLAQALAPRIRVNAIGPGPVLQSIHQDEEQFAKQQASTPLKRGATPEEIMTAVRFILSSPSITGQMIALDGGQHLAWQTPDVLNVEK